jgi:flagellar biosynthesis chaperone FliJ
MEKFFNQSEDIAQKPVGDSGFFNENEPSLINSEKKEKLFMELEEAQDSFNEINDKINKLLGDYKTNAAEQISDEKKLNELSAAFEIAQSTIKVLRLQIERINKGEKYLQSAVENEIIKN